jgi:hypothetical protein
MDFIILEFYSRGAVHATVLVLSKSIERVSRGKRNIQDFSLVVKDRKIRDKGLLKFTTNTGRSEGLVGIGKSSRGT